MVNFDRAAEFYDQTRGLAGPAMDAFVTRLREGLGDARRVIEIGVGTGRVAVPLARSGFDVTGVDISERMLAVLCRKTDDVAVHVADATRLPFPDDTYDGGVAVHVFHLIPEWTRAVAELVRVVGPGGVIVVVWRTSSNPLQEWSAALASAAEADFTPAGASSADELREELRRHATRVTDLVPVVVDDTTSLQEQIEAFESGVWSRHWRIDDEVRREAAAEVRADAVRQGIDLAATHPFTDRIEVISATLDD